MPFDRTRLEYRVKAYYRDTVPGASTTFYSGSTTQHDAYRLASRIDGCGIFEESHVEKHLQGDGWYPDDYRREPTDEGMEEMSAGIEGTPEVRACCNDDCDWTGLAAETVHPKHVPDVQLCPRCNETTECVGVQAQ